MESYSGIMSVNFYLLTVKKIDVKRLRSLLVYELVAVLVVCTALAFAVLGIGHYGDAGLWCKLTFFRTLNG